MGDDVTTAVQAPGIDGEGPSFYNWRGSNVAISGGNILMNAETSSVGVYITRGMGLATVRDVVVRGAVADGKAFVLETRFIRQFNNVDERVIAADTVTVQVASAATLIIPDVGERFFVSGTTGINTIRTQSQNTWHQKVRDVAMTNLGGGYDADNPPTVSITGGGGSGATATAAVSNNGTVIGAIITDPGSGYTSPPSVSIDSPPGAGVVATGVAVVGCNNQDGRQIELLFQGALTVSDGSNLSLNGTFNSVANQSILVLRGAYGSWYEVCRATS
jgi:hypothetical protein